MPQSRLPDINTAFVVYRREAITNLKSENFSACMGSLLALNALLPEKYRVTISDQDYLTKTKKALEAICSACTENFLFETLNLKSIVTPNVYRYLNSTVSYMIWICPKCKHENKLTETGFVEKVRKEPYFIQVVPKPPERKDGLMARSVYGRKFTQWFWTCIAEIEERMAQFRDDNWQKGDEYSEEYDLGIGEEES